MNELVKIQIAIPGFRREVHPFIQLNSIFGLELMSVCDEKPYFNS